MDKAAENCPVFLHYTQKELDRNFDQRAWISNAEEIIARHVARSSATAEKFGAAKRTFAYGEHADEKLDIFYANGGGPAPFVVFVHGGAWRNFTKDDYLFPAETFVPAGFHTAILNFSKLPGATVPEVVDQVRRGIKWVHEHAASLNSVGGLLLAAWSSGAHLSAMTLAMLGSGGADGHIVKSAFLISGSYDLEPVMLSARSSYVKLDSADVRRFSPQHNVSAIECPIYICYAEFDTDEFRRQSIAFASALRQAGKLSEVREFAGVNHFELMERLGEPNSELSQAIVRWGLGVSASRGPKSTARQAATGECAMARLRHFAIVVRDLQRSAQFYEGVFGLKRVGEETLDFASAVYLSDGVINLALLNYKGERGSGLTNAKDFVGAHHFGFQVDDLAEMQKKIEAAGGTFFFDLGNDEDKQNFERKFKDPDGIIFDVSKNGWLGATG